MYHQLEKQNKLESTIFALDLPTFLIQHLETCSTRMKLAFHDAPSWRVKLFLDDYPNRIDLVEPIPDENNEFSEQYQKFASLHHALIPDDPLIEVLNNNSDNLVNFFNQMNNALEHARTFMDLKQKEIEKLSEKNDDCGEGTSGLT